MKKYLLKAYFYLIAFPVISRIFIPIYKTLSRAFGIKTHFGQFGEDNFLTSYLPEKGFYLEIGCNHPVLASNSFNLYLRGWTGIVIDADASLKHLWKISRPKDLFVSAMIATDEGEANFYKHRANFVSTGSTEHLKKFNRNEFSHLKLKTRNINNILKENHVENLDLILIDIEGMDDEVLFSINLESYKAPFICIEDHDYFKKSKILEYLTSNGYELCYLNYPSMIYRIKT